MKKHSASAFCYGLLWVLLVFILPQPASSHTIDPRTIEQQIIDSDFVGIVECVQAGGIVSGYQVLKSWKGHKPGEIIYVRQIIHGWGPHFPFSRCGEKYFITGHKSPPPTNLLSFSTGGGFLPLWKRQLPEDYRLTLFQGIDHIISPAAEKKFAEQAERISRLSPMGTEVELYRSIAEKYRPFLNVSKEEQVPAIEAARKTLYDTILAATTKENPEKKDIEKILSATLELRKFIHQTTKNGFHKKYSYQKHIPESLIYQAGGQVTWEFLQGIQKDTTQAEKYELNDTTIEKITKRLSQKISPTPRTSTKAPPKRPAPPTAKQLEEMRTIFAKGEKDNREFWSALHLLIQHDPKVVLPYFKNWQNPEKRPTEKYRRNNRSSRGYHLGSEFALRCGGDREKMLTDLLDAKEDYVKVAAAVYLCYENLASGEKALRKFLKVPDDPGVWAALTLARRADKEALTRALEIYRLLPNLREGGIEEIPHDTLKKRVHILLLNSAWKSKVKLPPKLTRKEDMHEKMLEWWNENKEKIKLEDPWLPMLTKQKID